MAQSRLLSLSKITKVTLVTLGQMIKSARLERKQSQADLADRLNVSRYTVMALERGDPKVHIGAVFEAAYIVGVPLLSEDLPKVAAQVSHLVSVLPRRARRHSKKEKDNDF